MVETIAEAGKARNKWSNGAHHSICEVTVGTLLTHAIAFTIDWREFFESVSLTTHFCNRTRPTLWRMIFDPTDTER